MTIYALASTTNFAQGQQPNFVFIYADDLGWPDVGFNGNTTDPQGNFIINGENKGDLDSVTPEPRPHRQHDGHQHGAHLLRIPHLCAQPRRAAHSQESTTASASQTSGLPSSLRTTALPRTSAQRSRLPLTRSTANGTTATSESSSGNKWASMRLLSLARIINHQYALRWWKLGWY